MMDRTKRTKGAGWLVLAAGSLALGLGLAPPAPAKPAPGKKGLSPQESNRRAAQALADLPLPILSNPAVLKELKCGETQGGRIKAAVARIEAERARAYAIANGGNKERAVELLQKIEAAIPRARKDVCGKILTPRQRERLTQVALQVHGPEAMRLPFVADALKLSDKQKGEVKAILRAHRREVLIGWMKKAQVPPGRDDFAELARIKSKALDRCVRLFSKAQQAEWKRLSGAPFPVAGLKVYPNFVTGPD
jgi:hypothetical protein